MKRLSILILCCFFPLLQQAQVQTNISFEKDTVGIGDVNNLTIEIITPRPDWIKSYSLTNFEEIKPIVSFYQNDTVDLKTNAEFDYLDLNTAQPVLLNNGSFERRADGKFVHKNITRFVAWDIGIFQFPELAIQIDTSGGRQLRIMPLEQNDLIVIPPEGVVVEDTTQVIAPILPIIKEERSIHEHLWFLYLNLAAIAIVLLLLYLFRKQKIRKKALEEEQIIIRPAHEVAYEKLDDLDKKQLWQQGKIKEYQSELTYTVREYLENRFGIQALESTTGEINRSLKEVDFDAKHAEDLTQILQIADMVKFAKAKPAESIHQDFMTKARSFVDETLLIEKDEKDGLVE